MELGKAAKEARHQWPVSSQGVKALAVKVSVEMELGVVGLEEGEVVAVWLHYLAELVFLRTFRPTALLFTLRRVFSSSMRS